MKWIEKILAWLKRKPLPTVNDIKPVPGPTEQSADDLQIGAIARWLGPDFSKAQLHETARIKGAYVYALGPNKLYTDYTPYSWPTQLVNGKMCDAICCVFYYQYGKIVGGKFDWWTKGGQSVKTLENVHLGYGGHIMPKSGYLWTMNASVDGKWRTNIKAVTWK